MKENNICECLLKWIKHQIYKEEKYPDFDENGDEKTIDFVKMLKIVKSSGYTGYIGVEYEGERLSEEDGIIATRDLLIKVGQSI